MVLKTSLLQRSSHKIQAYAEAFVPRCCRLLGLLLVLDCFLLRRSRPMINKTRFVLPHRSIDSQNAQLVSLNPAAYGVVVLLLSIYGRTRSGSIFTEG